MVFQDYALFPHLAISDNVGFGLRGMSTVQKHSILRSPLETVGLWGWPGVIRTRYLAASNNA